LKATNHLSHIPVIAVTADARATDRGVGGGDDYLPKPLDEDWLMHKVQNTEVALDFGLGRTDEDNIT